MLGEIVAAAGHRPEKLGGYSEAAREALVEVARAELIVLKPRAVISGFALGWDQAVAAAAIRLCQPLWAYLPFKGQESKWPRSSQILYHELLLWCQKVEVCSDGGYEHWKMQYRNERMVEDGQRMLALWDGSKGGTSNCLSYARHVGRPIINCWEKWEAAWPQVP